MKLSKLVAIIAWISLFTETWLLLLKVISLDPLSVTIWILFVIVSVLASATQAPRKQ